jgi:hypothetical protein
MMPYLTQHGIYYVEYDTYTYKWEIDTLVGGYESDPLEEIIITKFFTGDVYSMFLYAINPVSAFTRAANAIIDKIEEKT